jgi:hypothetical protein
MNRQEKIILAVSLILSASTVLLLQEKYLLSGWVQSLLAGLIFTVWWLGFLVNKFVKK